MGAAIGFRIRIFILIRQHHATFAFTLVAEQYKGLCQRMGKGFLPGFDLSFPTAKYSFLTLHR